MIGLGTVRRSPRVEGALSDGGTGRFAVDTEVACCATRSPTDPLRNDAILSVRGTDSAGREADPERRVPGRQRRLGLDQIGGAASPATLCWCALVSGRTSVGGSSTTKASGSGRPTWRRRWSRPGRAVPSGTETSTGKLGAAGSARKVTTDAIQVLGDTRYIQDFPVGRFTPEANVMQIFEGTNQSQRLVISRHLDRDNTDVIAPARDGENNAGQTNYGSCHRHGLRPRCQDGGIPGCARRTRCGP